jgi:bacteriocin biosynthesis cyclodehydratase domain-containing protein
MLSTTSTAPNHVWNPATRVLWRGPDTVQLELGTRAVVVEGVDPDAVRHLVGTSATPPPQALRVPLDDLAALGFLWPATGAPATAPPRLAPELTGLQERFGRLGGQLLSSRRAACVVVHGAGRLATSFAALLAAAGVGRISFHDRADVRLRDACPGGLSPDDEGRPFRRAAVDVVRRVAPEVDTTPLSSDQRADLTVITAEAPVEDALRQSLHLRRAPYLVVQSAAQHLVIGPLVLPGITSCLRCADLHRSDRDPAWAALAVQLCVPGRYPPGGNVALTTLAASLATVQSLAFLDGEEPATLEATLEFHLPDWRIRRRSWASRADCECGAHLDAGKY